MSSRVAIGFILAASLATAAPWNKLNPFKGKPNGRQQQNQTASTAGSRKPKQEKPTTYTGIFTAGSVAAIPAQTEGRLDLNDPELFQFHYGKPTWSLAWTRVKAITVAEKTGAEPLLKIPKITRRMRVFTIEFDNAGFVEFDIPVQDSHAVLPLLELRSGKGVTLANAQTPGGWWGDAVWKTKRNAALWDEANPKPTVAQKD